MCNACYTRWILDQGDNREKHGEVTKAYYYKVKNEMFDAYGHFCSCCGESEEVFLSLEHIGAGGRGQRDRERLGSGFAVWVELKRLGWPKEGYTILCMNCQRGSLLEGGCPHKRKVN